MLGRRGAKEGGGGGGGGDDLFAQVLVRKQALDSVTNLLQEAAQQEKSVVPALCSCWLSSCLPLVKDQVLSLPTSSIPSLLLLLLFSFFLSLLLLIPSSFSRFFCSSFPRLLPLSVLHSFLILEQEPTVQERILEAVCFFLLHPLNQPSSHPMQGATRALLLLSSDVGRPCPLLLL